MDAERGRLELAEIEVAVGDERTHLQFIGERKRFTATVNTGE